MIEAGNLKTERLLALRGVIAKSWMAKSFVLVGE
jgi:hypothetical protein